MTEVLIVPVESVGAPDDAHHRRVQLGRLDTVVEDRAEHHWQSFDAIVSLSGAEHESTLSARSCPPTRALAESVSRNCVRDLCERRNGEHTRSASPDDYAT